MKYKQLIETKRLLESQDIRLEKGLSNSEILAIESKFGVTLPPDLKVFLQVVLPASHGFVNWWEGLIFTDTAQAILQRLNAPLHGLLFDVKNAQFWHDSWGEKPQDLANRLQTATHFYQSYPKLIPLYSHRYIPSHPQESGNPIFSVYQTDVIYYGKDLADYFQHEFTPHHGYDFEAYKYIPFWSYLAER